MTNCGRKNRDECDENGGHAKQLAFDLSALIPRKQCGPNNQKKQTKVAVRAGR